MVERMLGACLTGLRLEPSFCSPFCCVELGPTLSRPVQGQTTMGLSVCMKTEKKPQIHPPLYVCENTDRRTRLCVRARLQSVAQAQQR
jgi:hypothetical protein